MKSACLIPVFFILFSATAVFGQDVNVPEWAKEVVWYQIFPERFCNGDPSNDPALADTHGSWPHDDTSAWHISPWTSDWYEMQPWEKENGKDIWYQLQRRRYGGDLQGILNKLDYIKELGIGAIYLNPIFMAPSLHKYDAAMYHHVEPTFGPDPAGDKKMIAMEDPSDPKTWQWTSADLLALKLIDECHKRNIKIIFDGVFNHMGVNSFAFQDILKNQQNSKYKNWFTILSYDDSIAGTKFNYQGWFGVPDLPEIREDDKGIVDGPKQYIFECTKRWMAPDGNPENGIDGWRLDVAFCVDHDFWKDWRVYVKSINPEAYLTAEVIDKIEVVKPYLEGDEFDAVMNYGFGVISSEFFINKENRISVTQFDSLLRELRIAYPGDISYVMQNLFDSHDTQRFTSYLHNPDVARYRTWGEYFNKTHATNPAYNSGKPTAEEYQIQKLMALFQLTYVGAPMVYYGDEIGMWGANDPDCRKPMVWEDLKYADEVYNWDGSKKNIADKVFINAGMFEFYKYLISIRNNHPALQNGDFQTLLKDDNKNIYAFERINENEKIIVVLNNSSFETSVFLSPEKGCYKELLFGRDEYKITRKGISLKVPPYGGRILVKL